MNKNYLDSSHIFDTFNQLASTKSRYVLYKFNQTSVGKDVSDVGKSFKWF